MYWIKTHPEYPNKGFRDEQHCFMSFMAAEAIGMQTLEFQVIQSTFKGDAYLAFGNDYGDLER